MNDEIYKRLLKSGKWMRLRARYLARHPLCEDCEARGVTRLATEVHHITPIGTETSYEGMRRLAYDPGNLCALCHDCHEERHKELGSRSAARVQARRKRIASKFLADWCRTGQE